MTHNAGKTLTKKQTLQFLSLICSCLAFFSCLSSPGGKGEKSYELLVLYSQHPDKAHWIKQLEQGVRDGIRENDLRAHVRNVYLKHTVDPADTATHIAFLHLLLDSLSATPPDLILTNGDKATQALFSTGHPLAQKIPVVFSGVDYMPESYLAAHPNAVGFRTPPDFQETQRLASHLMGFRQNQCNVIDASPAGLWATKEISRQFWADTSASAILGPVWQPLPPDNTMGWKEEVYLLREGDLFGPGKYMISIKLLDEEKGTLLLSHARYNSLHYFTTACWNEFLDIIVQGRTIPFFSVNNDGFGKGYIGGYFTPGYKQTYEATNAAIRILKGDPLASIGITVSPKEYVFDWEMLHYWGIPLDRLPASSTIVNRPFEETHKTLLQIGGILLCFLLFGLLVILTQLSRKERLRKQQSAKMQEIEEQRLATTLDFLKEAVIAIDAGYRVTRMNKAAEILLSASGISNFRKQTIDSLCEITTVNNPQYLKQTIDTAGQSGQIQWFDRLTYLVTPDRHAFPISGCIIPIRQETAAKEVILAFRNILEEMTLNEFLELGIAAGETYPWRFDDTEQFILFDKNFFSNYRFPFTADEEDRLPLPRFVSCIHPEDRPIWEKAIRQAMEGAKLLTVEIRLRITDHTYLWTEFSISTYDVLTSQGILRQPFGICTDINNLKDKQKELETLLKKAKISDENKTLFLANMSHEIRTPLNAIVGFSTLLAESDELSGEERQTFIELINENSQSLLTTINDILDISRIESGIRFQQTPFAVDDLIRKVKEEQEEKLPAGIRFRLAIPDEPVVITGDSFRLWQMLSNLVSNAIKFTREGSIEIGLTPTPNEVSLYVKDTGIGISDEQQKKIFDRFYRADNFTKGTGLGLSLCLEIIQRMQGRITCKSIYGKGTTFDVCLPVNPAPQTPATNIGTP